MSKLLCDELSGVPKTIFLYQLQDAWGIPIKSVIVTDINIMLFGDEDETKVLDFDNKNLISILNKYVDDIVKHKDDELPSPPVLDGYNNRLAFKINNKDYCIDICNLGFYDEEDINNNEYLKLLSNLYEDIYNEFKSQINHIDKYFVLSDEVEE